MAARVGRLKRRPEFLRVAAARRKFAAPGLVLQVASAAAATPGTGSAGMPAEGAVAPVELRVGFTASRKVGNAVHRNRARRRLKALVADLFPGHARPEWDYVVIARQAAVERPYLLLRNDLEAALRRLGAWREPAPSSQNRPVASGRPGHGERNPLS